MAVWKCSFLTQEREMFLHMAKQEGICVNPASLLIIYNKKAQRFCRATKTYTPRHAQMGNAASAQAAATAGGEGTRVLSSGL